MQTAIVIIIVFAAACYLLRRFYRNFHDDGQSDCGCGCDGCSPSRKSGCDETDSRSP